MKAWGIYLAIAAGAYIATMTLEADRDSSGAVVGEGNIDAFQIRVGDCFNDSSSMSPGEDFEVTGVAGVPCSEPHDNEVYAVFDVDVPEFPEGDGMSTLAFDSCLERFEGFVGKDYQTSTLDILTMYPTRESWSKRNDREVICAVYDMNLAKLTGSTRGLAL